jgi:RND family efflux transporter MFP subunit
MSITEKPNIASLRIERDDSTPPPPPSHGKRRIGIAVVIVAAGTGAFFLLRGKAPVEVETTTVSLTSPSQANAVLNANGYVVAQRKAAVASKGSGRLVYLGVEEGDKVLKGQILARLEDQDVVAAYEKANADLAVARADSLDAVVSLERQRALHAAHLASDADYDAARARAGRVIAGIASARAAVDGAAVGVENTRIRAPFSGTVLTKDADVGEVVAPFASSTNSRGAVVSIADMGSVQVEADVSESNITRVTVGQPCEIVLDAYPDRRYHGTVHKIVPTADRAKATVLTKVAFNDLDDHVLPEMSAKITFLSNGTDSITASSPPVTTVPTTSVTNRNGTTVVLVVRNDRIVETPVRTGAVFGNRTEIKEGVGIGDRVVLRPDPTMSTGTSVTVHAN